MGERGAAEWRSAMTLRRFLPRVLCGLWAILFVFTGISAEAEKPFVHGIIIANVLGPNQPTSETVIPSAPGTLTNFWVTLKVVDGRDGFGAELKGKTIRLPTGAFSNALIGQTLPLWLSRNAARNEKSETTGYWLTCTSLEISRWVAAAQSRK